MKKRINDLMLAILAGIAIGIGGTAFLKVEDPIIGAILFTVGLFTVCTNKLHLFTGRAGYVLDEPPSYLFDLLITWIGNLIGAAIIGYGLRLTRISGIADRAAQMCATKMSDTPWSIFILAFFCGMLMYVAVDGFRKNEHQIGKYLGLLLCVPGFIVCGFEHCVANMYYISVANAWNIHSVLYLIIMTLGNLVGCFSIPGIKKICAGTK
ncbi:MAG: formate/nitrite transporter family protein [Clostridia bacterium]